MFYDDHWMWGMHGGWWIGGLILLIIFVWAVRRRSQTIQTGPPPSKSGKSALDVLKRRYAEGEISTEEFEERKRNLRSD